MFTRTHTAAETGKHPAAAVRTRLTAILLAAVLTVSAIAGAFGLSASAALAESADAPAAPQAFTDVPSTYWAYADIQEAASAGWVQGVGGGKFNPEGQLSTSEFAALLTRAFYGSSLAGAEQNAEAGDPWWVPAMETAYLKGLLIGTDAIVSRESTEFTWDTASVTKPMSRYDMAAMISNLLGQTGRGAGPEKAAQAQSSIPDYSSIPEKYKSAVSVCYATGMLTGTDSKGTFNGTAVMTRAQAAAVLCRLT